MAEEKKDKPIINRIEIEKSVKEMRMNFEAFSMLMDEYSKILYNRFESLMNVGFTDEQALDIIKARGLE